MSSPEKLCLKWNDFKETVSSTLGELRTDQDLTDVTLACEDGVKQVEAHKVILAASSPFFMDILKRNKHPHPLIYMRGLNSEDLLAIIDFIYFGEAKVLQKNLESFLSLADDLRLKGLTENDKEKEAAPTHLNMLLKKEKDEEHKITSSFENEGPATHPDGEMSVAVTNNLLSTDLQNLDDQIKSMMTKTDVRSDKSGKCLATCNICGKKALIGNMPSHIEANHISGVSHACDICGKFSRSRDAIRMHKNRAHKTLFQDQDQFGCSQVESAQEKMKIIFTGREMA